MGQSDQNPPQFAHWCDSIDFLLDENEAEILDCRCYDSPEFFAAQDSMAVKLDLQRTQAQA